MAEQRGNPDPGAGADRATMRIGGIAVLFVLAVVSARARASGYLPHVASPPGALVLGIIRMIGIGVLASGLVLLLWGRRAQRRKLAGGKPVAKKLDKEQRRRVVVAVLVGLIAALVYEIVLQLIGPPSTQKQQQSDQGQNIPVDGHGWIDLAKGHHPGEAGIGTYVSVVLALLALVLLAVVLLRRRYVVEIEDEDGGEEAETVAMAMAAGQVAVRDETILDPRQAIVACFAAMERALAGVGGDVAPRAADTPEEVLRRGVSGARLPQEPATTLLELFREARFSMHPMHQADRDSADRALAQMRESLSAVARQPR